MNWERQSTLLIEGLKNKGMTQTDLARELFKIKKPTPGNTQIINNWRHNRQGITIRRVKEVCDIVGHHHHPRDEETTNFKVIYDADLIVNLEENQKEKASPPDRLAAIINQSFLTDSGRELAVPASETVRNAFPTWRGAPASPPHWLAMQLQTPPQRKTPLVAS
jgi:hypothetical protein